MNITSLGLSSLLAGIVVVAASSFMFHFQQSHEQSYLKSLARKQNVVVSNIAKRNFQKRSKTRLMLAGLSGVEEVFFVGFDLPNSLPSPSVKNTFRILKHDQGAIVLSTRCDELVQSYSVATRKKLMALGIETVHLTDLNSSLACQSGQFPRIHVEAEAADGSVISSHAFPQAFEAGRQGLPGLVSAALSISTGNIQDDPIPTEGSFTFGHDITIELTSVYLRANATLGREITKRVLQTNTTQNEIEYE